MSVILTAVHRKGEDINGSVTTSFTDGNATTKPDASQPMESKYSPVDQPAPSGSLDGEPGQGDVAYLPRDQPSPPADGSSGQADGPPVSLRTHLLSMWYLVVIIVTPVIMLPIILVVNDEYQNQARCGYVIAVMAVYWTTEAMPIPVTSLLPVVLLPLLGVLRARDTASAYFNDTSMLFVGGLLVAISIEVWDVHKRLALITLRVVGSEPKFLLLGVTVVTWFLSMWISNTATAAMMMTIAQALLGQYEKVYRGDYNRGIATGIDVNNDGGEKPLDGSPHKAESDVIGMDRIDKDADVERVPEMTREAKEEFSRLSKALCLSVAYSANIGGVASLTGTGPNLVLLSNARRVFEGKGLESPVNFSSWLVYGLPLSLIVVAIQWVWIVFFYLRCRGSWPCCRGCHRGDGSQSDHLKSVDAVIKAEYRKLGPVSYAQKTIFVSFLLLVILWISRDLGGSGGWGSLFEDRMVSDSTPSILFGVLMFVLPATFPGNALCKSGRRTLKRVEPLLKWKHVHEKMPWTLYLLLGGGFAIAKASTESGLSAWLGDQLLVFRELNQWLVLLIICYIVAMATEVTSNTAMATLMMPILSEMAISLGVNPLFYMFPAALATSFAFMLPVATPPNAIVFSSGAVRVIDMVTCGLFMNIVGIPVILLATYTWGNAYFQFDVVPPEFVANATSAAAS